jgi:hypothetical protein
MRRCKGNEFKCLMTGLAEETEWDMIDSSWSQLGLE